ncbi:hypothetical protein ABZP12_04174 [Xanthomonas euvesicatoria]
MGNGEWRIGKAGRDEREEGRGTGFTIPDSLFSIPGGGYAARLSDSVSDSMLAALGLTSQNLPM